MHGESFWECALRYFVFGEAYWFSYCIFVLLMLMIFIWQDGPPVKAFILCGLLVACNICYECSLGISLLGAFNYSDEIFDFVLKLLRNFPFMLAGYIMHYYREGLRSLYSKFKLLLLPSAAIAAIGFVAAWSFGRLTGCESLHAVPGCAAMMLLYGAAEKLPKNISVFKKAGSLSYQIMLLDSFFKVVLFRLAAKLFAVNIWFALPMALVDLCLCLIVCGTAKKLSPAAFLLGFGRE